MTNDSPLMNMLGTNMRYMSQRQGVLAHNIANADTPNYRTQDMKSPDFNAMLNGTAKGPQFQGASQVRLTNPKHMMGTIGTGNSFRAQEVRNAQEITPVGNNVVLEEEMAKISQTGAQYQTTTSLLKKFDSMYRNALGQR